MKKTYSVTVDLPELPSNPSSVVATIMQEEQSRRHWIDTIKEKNQAVYDLSAQVLSDFIRKLNEAIEPLGVGKFYMEDYPSNFGKASLVYHDGISRSKLIIQCKADGRREENWGTMITCYEDAPLYLFVEERHKVEDFSDIEGVLKIFERRLSEFYRDKLRK